MEAMKCAYCQTEFPNSSNKKYCGAKCRRASEFGIRRANYRIENLEKARMNAEMEVKAPTQYNDCFGRNPAERLLAIEVQIQKEKARFLELL